MSHEKYKYGFFDSLTPFNILLFGAEGLASETDFMLEYGAKKLSIISH